jgi:hypothetical protein
MLNPRAQLAVVVLALVAGGCFTREETIEVRPDGSAVVTYEVEGSHAELAAAAGLPSAAGWSLREETVTADEGGEKVHRSWGVELDDLNQYPRVLTGPNDPFASTAPAMETTLEMDRQQGRTVYTFTRRYIGRRAGKFEDLKEDSDTAAFMERAGEEGFDALTAEEQDTLFAGLAEYAAAAMWLRVRDALGEAVLVGTLGTTAYEETVARIEAFLQERLTGSYLQTYFAADEQTQDRELARLRADLRARIGSLLPAGSLPRILDLLEEEERRFQVTQDLGDDSFWLTVKMPGTIVAGNALMFEAGEVAWEFTGADLLRGDLVLTAVSVLENGQRP